MDILADAEGVKAEDQYPHPRDHQTMVDDEKISSFLEKLKNLSLSFFVMQPDNEPFSPIYTDPKDMGEIEYFYWTLRLPHKKALEIEVMDLGDIKHYSHAELRAITNNFSRHNLISRLQNGRIFQGEIEQGLEIRKVAVKLWDFWYPPELIFGARKRSFHDELVLLMDPAVKAHRNFAKLIGFCCVKKMAAIYEIEPRGILHDLLTSDDFGWEDRMKVAKDFGSLLQFSHEKLIAFGSIDAKHIFIDEESNVKLFDFGFYNRVKEKNATIKLKYASSEFGYYAPELFKEKKWSIKSDVFAYGVLLLNLIAKRDDNSSILEWATAELASHRSSLVHESFGQDKHRGDEITKLAMSCLDAEPQKRPDMATVVEILIQCSNHSRGQANVGRIHKSLPSFWNLIIRKIRNFWSWIRSMWIL